jgi:DNA-binding transcriptional LysR family regulator
LPKIVKSYRQKDEKAVVRIRDAAVEQMIDMVEAGEVDLAMGPDRTSGDSVMRVSLFKSPWVLWCSSDHHLARKRVLRWNDLRGEALVTAGRDHERSVAKMRASLPDEERISPVDVVDNITTALGIAAEGLAVTLSPAYVSIWAERFDLVKRRVIEPEAMREVCLYMPTQRVLSPVARSFAEFVSKDFGVALPA